MTIQVLFTLFFLISWFVFNFLQQQKMWNLKTTMHQVWGASPGCGHICGRTFTNTQSCRNFTTEMVGHIYQGQIQFVLLIKLHKKTQRHKKILSWAILFPHLSIWKLSEKWRCYLLPVSDSGVHDSTCHVVPHSSLSLFNMWVLEGKNWPYYKCHLIPFCDLWCWPKCNHSLSTYWGKRRKKEAERKNMREKEKRKGKGETH